MRIKCVFGHTKCVVLACCERVITFVPECLPYLTVLKSGILFSVLKLYLRDLSFKYVGNKNTLTAAFSLTCLGDKIEKRGGD